MSELATMARPYAAALYRRARETQSTEEWSQSLEFLSQIVRDERVASAASNPKVKKNQLEKFVLDLCEGKISEEAKNLVKLLIHNNRLKLLGEISERYERSRADDEGYVEAEVTSAYPLDEKDEHFIASVLQKKFGRRIRILAAEDRTLIGGVLIRTGDKVIDASVRGHIDKLAKRLSN
jgi:F-type H+-transporting ATPase subunit delta